MQEKILSLSNKLISIPSTKDNSTDLEKVILLCKKELRDIQHKKYKKNNIPSLLFYNTSKFPKRFKVILNAHLDVVPGIENQYKSNVKGDKLYGRGAVDMKSAAAVMILLYKELAKKVTYPLGLQLVTDEEIGGFNGTKYQIEKGVRADFVISGEPTNFGINNQAKGVVWAKITAKGKSAHGAYPWLGVNALEKINDFLNKLLKEFPSPLKEEWRTMVNIAKIETQNETFNKVPDNATVWLDIRYVPREEKTIVRKLKKIADGFDTELILKEPPQFTDENNPFVYNLRKATKEITYKLPPIIAKHGGSDIRHYNAVGCEGVTFGPVGAGLHTDNEWVSIKSLVDYYEILKNFLLSL